MNTTVRRIAATAVASAIGIAIGAHAGLTDRTPSFIVTKGKCSVILNHPTGQLWACTNSTDTTWVPKGGVKR